MAPFHQIPGRLDRPRLIKVHIPEEGGPFPVVVLSHGGGGNRDANFAQARHLATHGFAVLCTEGRPGEVIALPLRLFVTPGHPPPPAA